MTSNSESEVNENVLSDLNQTPAEQQPIQVDDSNNENLNTDESPSTTTTRTSGQTAIGAKLVKKLETLAASSKENKQSNGKTSTVVASGNGSASSANANNNESESRRNINKVAKNLLKSLTDPDPQKNLLNLAVKVAEYQEQSRTTQTKIHELEKKTAVLMRERDQVLLENGRVSAAKAKLESLCRELHQHNQQIRDESIQRQQEDETKRRELATKFQTTIDEIASQLSNYSEKSTSLREQNIKLSEQLASVVKDYELREKEVETTLKKKELELRLTEATLEQSRVLLNERTELIKQERQVSEAEQLVLYRKCEELAQSELSLRSQVTVYAERYQEFQNAIQQSSQMVTSCHSEIEKMGKKIKKLEKERNDFRHRWEIAETSQRKTSEDMKLLEKEKRQSDIKLDKLDRLCRALQQERLDLQGTIKNLTKSSSITPSENCTPSSTTASSTLETDKTTNVDASKSSETPTINEHDAVENNEVVSTTTITADTDGSPNLYDSELGRIAKTVD
ncbi:unnamed protein product [Adineta steineri]|uniref:Alpha-taxilin n=1 Tax=Adineta steineri TaxID=433720 RepID=A0A815HMQ6_9BILA|nr:unnamed protein product [Adineta steineri]